MGKFFLSSKQEWSEKLDRGLSEVGFLLSGKIEDFMKLYVYKKLHVDNPNFWEETGNGEEYPDFIASSGTLLYDGKFGEEALRRLLADIRHLPLKEVRKNLMGNFAVICRTDGKIRIFCDETGTYSVCYYIDPSNPDVYLISNTFFHVQICAGQELKPYNYLEYILCPEIFNNETPFENIFRLCGDEVLEITKSGAKIVKTENNEYELDNTSIDSAAVQLAGAMLKYAKIRTAIPARPILFMTGGVDSRLILSTYLAAGTKPVLGNWQGCPDDMNTQPNDRVMAEEIAEKFGLTLEKFDISHDIEADISNLEKKNFWKYGEYCAIYGNNRKWYEIFEKGDYNCWEFGHLGEELRNFETLERAYRKPFGLKDFYLKVRCNEQDFFRFRSNGGINLKGLHQNIYRQYADFARRRQLNVRDLSLEDCQLMLNYNKQHSEMIKANMYNMNGYYTNLYSQKEIYDYSVKINYEYKKNKRIILKMIQNLMPELNEIRYFTRCQFVNSDPEKCQLEEIRTTRTKIRDFIQKTPAGDFITDLYTERTRYKRARENSELLKVYTEKINASKVIRKMQIEIKPTSFTYMPNYGIMLINNAYMDELLKEEE